MGQLAAPHIVGRVQAGQAQVEDFDHPSLGGHDQVGRLDVPMHEALNVGMLQSQGSLPHIARRLARRQPAVLLEQPRQVGAGNVLHDQEERVADLVGIVSEDDVGMRQFRRRLDLTAEAVQERRMFHKKIGPQHFQGDEPVHEGVACLVDLAHAALTEPFEQHIRTEHELLSAALQDLVGLERSEPTAADQLRRHLLGILSQRLAEDLRLNQLVGRQKSVRFQFGEETGQCLVRHGSVLSGSIVYIARSRLLLLPHSRRLQSRCSIAQDACGLEAISKPGEPAA